MKNNIKISIKREVKKPPLEKIFIKICKKTGVKRIELLSFGSKPLVLTIVLNAHKYPRSESNTQLMVRSHTVYPLAYGSTKYSEWGSNPHITI